MNSFSVSQRRIKAASDVHFLLPWLDPFHQITVPASGTTAVHSQVTTADVRCCYEDLFCTVHRCRSGRHLHRICHALRSEKGERNMELFYGEYAGHDIDTVLTTRELTRMIRAAHIDPKSLKDRECDPLMKEWSGAGVIFGATGGVMEAALRSAHYLVTGRNPDPDAFKIVRSPSFETGVVEAEVQIGDATIRAAVVSGLGNVRKLLEAIEHGEVHYDFVEVMACPGGCVGGGGQPIHDGEELAHTRGANLYFLDKNAKIRFSHENQDVMKLYNDFLEKPLSHKSHMLLHTDHTKWDMPR